jgi:hypothetical protein
VPSAPRLPSGGTLLGDRRLPGEGETFLFRQAENFIDMAMLDIEKSLEIQHTWLHTYNHDGQA